MTDRLPVSVRRIVTGEPTPGDSTFTHIEEVPPLSPRPAFGQYYVWGFDEIPELPHHSAEPYVPRSHFPGAGGVRVTANVMGASPAGREHNADDLDEFTRLQAAEPFGRATGSVEGMHRTDTIDIGVVVSGEITVESEDGASVTMGPGDVYIQNGAQHRGVPKPDNPALMVFVLVGAKRTGEESQQNGT